MFAEIKMKKSDTLEKKNGKYYTPVILADFIVQHLFDNYTFDNEVNVLEPSIGDGIFLESFFNNGLFRKQPKLPKNLNILGIEKNEEAISLSANRAKRLVHGSHVVLHKSEDYLDFHLNNKSKFDLIIGNPPYIKGHRLTKKQLEQCTKIHKQSNLSTKTIKNIWTSFLVGAVQSLSKNGVICYVLPAELLQVVYTKELRNLLIEKFDRIEIFAFGQPVFNEIEQDVIVLFCAKGTKKSVAFYHVKKLDDLKKPDFADRHANVHRETLDKWTNYILKDVDLKFLDGIKSKFSPIKDYCDSSVGIVTAANDYFIVNEKTVKEKGLDKIARPILQKGMHMPRSVSFTKKDFKQIVKDAKPSFFLAFINKKIDSLTKAEKDYLALGEKRDIHERYKCKLRENWYFVPSVWISEGFFTKRSDIFPRTIVNEAGVIVTDSFYRINMKEGNKIQDLAFSFYNSATLIFAELEGRYYGGSVLELTPNEYKNLSIPYISNVPKKHLNKLDKMLRSGSTITEILDYTDGVILRDHFKMKDSEVKRLRRIYKDLVNRRLKKRSI